MIRSKLTDEEIISLYKNGVSIKDISQLTQITRPAIYNTLKRNKIEVDRRKVLQLNCLFCNEEFTRQRSLNKNEHSGYCSIQCFHAHRSTSGIYSKRGSELVSLHEKNSKIKHRELGRISLKVIKEAGIILETGQVIHHIDGNRNNNNLENLQIFNSHSEHMNFHHKKRNNKLQ